MIIWGGLDSNLNDYDTGARYSPSANSWSAISTFNAPSGRDSHTAVWTGSEMIVWGGVCCSPGLDFDTGGRYDPGMDSWTATSTLNVPHARDSHTAVWTGDKMVIWGGGYYVGNNYDYLNSGGVYYAATPLPTLQSAVSRKRHGVVADFDISLPLDGAHGIECRSGGNTSDYTMVITFSATVTINGSPQAAVTSGVGTVGSNGVGNGGVVQVSGNIVVIPLTSVANAETIQVTLYGVNGSTNFVIPMSILVGDTNGNGAVNASDLVQTKSRIGQQMNQTNFRSDVTANGFIDSVDIALLKSKIGTGLP